MFSACSWTSVSRALIAFLVPLFRFKGFVADVRVLPNGELVYDIDYRDGEIEEGLPEKFVRPVLKTGAKRGAFVGYSDMPHTPPWVAVCH